MHTSRAITASLALGALLLAGCPSPSGPAKPQGTSRSAYLASLPLQSVDGVVKFGAVKPCGDSMARTIQIRNQSAEPIEIKAYASNCGCLTADFVGDRTMAPGELRDLVLTVHPSGIGERSVAVEFAGPTGFLGSVRADYSLNGGVSAIPAGHDLLVQGAPEVLDVAVRANDGRTVKVLSMEPPVGSVGTGTGEPGVSISTAEILEFLSTPAGRAHPGVTTGASGEPIRLRIDVVTDHPDCPLAPFEVNIRK